MGSDWFRLSGKTPVRMPEGQYPDRKRDNWCVGRTSVGKDVQVSTVFLGLDHGYGEGPPILFETLVFGGPLDQSGDRYCTWEEAEAGHERWVKAAGGESEGSGI